jgi:hypothetical protein
VSLTVGQNELDVLSLSRGKEPIRKVLPLWYDPDLFTYIRQGKGLPDTTPTAYFTSSTDSKKKEIF